MTTNHLGELSAYQLGQILRDVKAKKLSLTDNNLQHHWGDGLGTAFEKLSADVEELALQENNLSRLDTPDLITALAALKFIKNLNLSRNELGQKSATDLQQIFQSFSGSVSTLLLTGNNLGNSLATALPAIDIYLKTLDISDNDLDQLTAEQLANVFAATPRGVTELIVRQNKLGSHSSADLAAALARIPANVKKLQVSTNDWNLKSDADLAEIVAAIPDSVEFIGFDDMRYIIRRLLLQRYPRTINAAAVDTSRLGEEIAPVSNDSFLFKMPRRLNRRRRCFLVNSRTHPRTIHPGIHRYSPGCRGSWYYPPQSWIIFKPIFVGVFNSTAKLS